MLTQSSDGHVPQPHTQQPTSVQTSPTSSADQTDDELSIIGRDLTIAGDRIEVSSEASLRVDGTIEGDVRAVHIAVGPHGTVQGTLTAESVDVLGRVVGAIQGHKVTLRSSAEVDGDIHQQSLIIEHGALFNGRAVRSEGATERATTTAQLDIQQTSAA